MIAPCEPPFDRAVGASPAGGDDAPPCRLWTVPNLICLVRLAGSPLLVWFAWLDRPGIVVGLLLTGLIGDWIDGKIARWLDQRSALGPMLDTAADVVMYAALAGAVLILRHGFVLDQAGWFVAIGASYALSVAIALVRFRRWPTYHTRAAKVCWLLVGIAAVALLLEGPAWPLHIAAGAVVLTNLEAAAIGWLLEAPRCDVSGLYTLLRRRRAGRSV